MSRPLADSIGSAPGQAWLEALRGGSSRPFGGTSFGPLLAETPPDSRDLRLAFGSYFW